MDLGGRDNQYVQLDEMSTQASQVRDWLMSNPGIHTYQKVGGAAGIHPKAIGSIMRALDGRGLNLGHRVVKSPRVPKIVKSEDIKSEDIKSEDIKSEDIKSEDIKSEDIKSEDIKSENPVEN